MKYDDKMREYKKMSTIFKTILKNNQEVRFPYFYNESVFQFR